MKCDRKGRISLCMSDLFLIELGLIQHGQVLNRNVEHLDKTFLEIAIII